MDPMKKLNVNFGAFKNLFSGKDKAIKKKSEIRNKIFFPDS